MQDYLDELTVFVRLQNSLHTALELIVALHRPEDARFTFIPTEATILAQIQHWPNQRIDYVLPPAAWVKPNRGIIIVKDQVWEFCFHGEGISFVQPDTRQDVSIEYSREGLLGITQHTFLIYLETKFPAHALIHYPEKFERLVHLAYLREVTPLLPGDDRIFVIDTHRG